MIELHEVRRGDTIRCKLSLNGVTREYVGIAYEYYDGAWYTEEGGKITQGVTYMVELIDRPKFEWPTEPGTKVKLGLKDHEDGFAVLSSDGSWVGYFPQSLTRSPDPLHRNSTGMDELMGKYFTSVEVVNV